MVTPVQVDSYIDQARDQLLRLIATHRLTEGMRLPPERVLASEFGISRPALREVLRSLGDQGFVEARRGSGWFVKSLNDAATETMVLHLRLSEVSAQRLVEGRRVLEPAAARFAAERRSDADLAALEATLEALRLAASTRSAIDTDAEFHELLARATDNVFFTLAIRPIMVALRHTREEAMSVQGVRERVLLEHAAILDAIRAGDGEAAEAAMHYHLMQVERDVGG